MMNIYEVLGLGVVVAGSESLGVLVTANATYLNFWVEKYKNRWENIDVRSFGDVENLLDLSATDLISRAESFIEEVMEEK
ncbi:MAG: hypothetical protein DRQ88_06095 [Epsilonproteobacteria bacterium]|nr:MAG: hypothetical protein DRQ88_06095 [Campylobacterota bacterium]